MGSFLLSRYERALGNGKRADRGANAGRFSRGKRAGGIGGRRRVMTSEVVDRCPRMLANGTTRQQVADVTRVGVKAIYKSLPVNNMP